MKFSNLRAPGFAVFAGLSSASSNELPGVSQARVDRAMLYIREFNQKIAFAGFSREGGLNGKRQHHKIAIDACAAVTFFAGPIVSVNMFRDYPDLPPFLDR